MGVEGHRYALGRAKSCSSGATRNASREWRLALAAIAHLLTR